MSVVFNHQRLAVALFDSSGLRVTTKLEPKPAPAPAAILEASFHRHQARFQRLMASQGQDEDAQRVCPVSLRLTKDGQVEAIGRSRPLSHVRAMQEAFSDVMGEANLGPGLFVAPHTGFASSIALHAAVLTAEGQLLVPRRSEYWVKDPGLWSASFSTELLPEEFTSGTLDDAMLRLFAQVLNVDDTSAVLGSVKTVGVLVDMQTYAWYFLAVADFRGLGDDFSAANLMARREYSPGAYEFDDCAAIPLSADDFQHLVARKEDLHDIRALAELQLIANACGPR
jgi:hypothetical protein